MSVCIYSLSTKWKTIIYSIPTSASKKCSGHQFASLGPSLESVVVADDNFFQFSIKDSEQFNSLSHNWIDCECSGIVAQYLLLQSKIHKDDNDRESLHKDKIVDIEVK